jgi:hypothetical protein
MPPPSLAPYVNYDKGMSSSSRRRHRTLTPLPSSSSSSSYDEAEEGRVISPEDYVKDEAEEAHMLVDALAASAKATAAEKMAEKVDRRAALQAVAAF